MEKLTVRDMFFKAKNISSEEHLITYNEYVDKDDALLIQKADEKQLAEIINLHRKYENFKVQNKGGKPSKMVGKNFILSFPDAITKIIADMDEKEIIKMAEHFKKIFLEGVKNAYPKANIKKLSELMTIAFHTDTEHFHYHFVVPSVIPSGILGNDFSRIDYSHYNISTKMRREQYKYCHNLLYNQEISIDEIKEKSKNERRKKSSKNWEKRIAQIKSKAKSLEEAEKSIKEFYDEVSKRELELKNAQEHFKAQKATYEAQTISEIEKMLSTASKQLENGNTQRAETTLLKAKEKIDQKNSINPLL